MKRAHDFVSSFVRLVSASLSGSFGLLLSSYGRLFIKFLLFHIADDTVAGAFSLKAAQCAFYVFVFTNSYRGHTFHLPLPLHYSFYPVIIATKKQSVKSFFAPFSTFFRFFPFFRLHRKNMRRIQSDFVKRTIFYSTCSKSSAGCLHQGHTKSLGNSSPS